MRDLLWPAAALAQSTACWTWRPVNWTQTLAQSEVQQALAANVCVLPDGRAWRWAAQRKSSGPAWDRGRGLTPQQVEGGSSAASASW